ncbi:MAG: ABC transporter permease [Thermoguttaceae bacterium]
MSLWKIAWRSIQQRTLASALTTLSMALGVSLVIAVLVVYSVVYQSFHRGGEGYDLVVGGAKGSRLDLVLSAVYYMNRQVEPMPYEYYQKLVHGNVTDGIDAAVPICLGDKYEGFPVVGTTPDLFDALKLPDGQHYQFAAGGRNFKTENFTEAVIGATVAEKTGLKVGKTFRPTHDVGATKGHIHDPFTIVGVLRPTGTPNDRALFVNIEGFYRQAGHLEAMLKGAEGAAADKDDEHEHGHHHEHEVIPDRLKRVTAVLVCLDPDHPERIRPVAQTINQGAEAQAAVPGDEISQLFEGTIGDVQWVLLLFAVMIVIVAGIGIMVSIYNSMSDRRQEIAVMRALGADRVTIMLVVLLESILLSLGGGVLGLLLGHGVVELLGPLIAERIGMSVNLLQFRAMELVLIPGLVVLASVVGYLPAVAAYRTDVARWLMAAP